MEDAPGPHDFRGFLCALTLAILFLTRKRGRTFRI